MPDADGNRVVLVVDDEVKTCVNLSRLLSFKKGYSVVTAFNGIDAIRILEEDGEAIDIVVTDMYMPLATGFDLIGHIKKNKMHQKVILISGGDRALAGVSVDDDKLLQHAVKFGKVDFLQKPFQVDELIEKIG